MIKKDLIKALDVFNDDDQIVITDDQGHWDTIQTVGLAGGMPAIIYGGSEAFSERS